MADGLACSPICWACQQRLAAMTAAVENYANGEETTDDD